MINGHAGPSPEEWDQYRGLVLKHDGELSRLAGVPEMVRKVVDQVNRIESIVASIESWREDSKVQYINTLNGRVKSLEHEKDEARREVERDRLDLRRSVRAAVVSALVSALVGWGAARLIAQPQPAPQAQGSRQ